MSRGIVSLLTATTVLMGGLLVAPAEAGTPTGPEPSRAARVFGNAVPVQSWPVPTGDAGLSQGNQGPYFGNGGIVSWRGALWFAEENAFKIGRVDTAGNVTESAMPPDLGDAPYGPFMLSAARDDQLWFVAQGYPLEGRVGRVVTGASGNLEAAWENLGYARSQSVAADPTGGAWSTYDDGKGISYRSTDFTETYFEDPTYSDGKIIVGPDGAAWFTDGGGVIKHITRAGAQVNYAATGDTGTITSLTSSGGNVWYAKFGPGTVATPSRGGIIGKMSPTGVARPFPAPVKDLTPSSLTPGSDGNVWFTTGHGTGIGRITPTGVYQLASMPAGNSADSITFGPDGQLWYVDAELNRVGRILVSDFEKAIAPAIPPPGAATPRIAAQVLKVKKGVTRVAVSCKGNTGRCTGSLTIAKPKGSKAVLAKGKVNVKVGATAKVRAKLTKQGKKALRQKARAKVKVTITTATGTVFRKLVLKR